MKEYTFWQKYIHNNRGLTLVEVLVTVAIFAIICSLVIAVTIQGVNHYQMIQTDALLRSEADYIMTRFMNELYTAYDVKNVTVEEIENVSLIALYNRNREKEATLGFHDGQALINDSIISSAAFDLLDSHIEFDQETNIVEVMITIRHRDQQPDRVMQLQSQVATFRAR